MSYIPDHIENRFTAMVQEHHGDLLGYAKSHAAQGVESAEDALQEAYLGVWSHMSNGKPVQDDGGGLLFAALRNRLSDQRRRACNRHEVLPNDPDYFATSQTEHYSNDVLGKTYTREILEVIGHIKSRRTQTVLLAGAIGGESAWRQLDFTNKQRFEEALCRARRTARKQLAEAGWSDLFDG